MYLEYKETPQFYQFSITVTTAGGCSPTGCSTPDNSSPLPSRSSSRLQNQASNTRLPTADPAATGPLNQAQQAEKGGQGSEEDSKRSSQSQTQQLGHGMFGPSSCDASTPSAQRSQGEEGMGAGEQAI
eukprot:1162097-Pelagomonas_calceolata.AAC.3